jgi:concanavalin A-like lectin/glucanase superfamily protein
MKVRGFALATVVLLLALIAASVFLVTRAAGTGVNRVDTASDAATARYAAEAGMTHALWLAQNNACKGYTLPATSFGAHTYQAAFSPTADSPVVVKATGTTASGAVAQVSRSKVTVYDASNPQTFTLQFDDTTGKDSILDDFYPIRNYGGASYLQINSQPAWTSRPLIEFDVSAIPAGAKVLSAQLELKQQNVSKPGLAGVYRLTRSWQEGTRNGGGIADGATWQTFDGSSAWSQAGGDFDPTLYAATSLSDADSGQWVGWEVRDLVQLWVSGTPNYGLMLAGDGAVQNASFASRETNNPLDTPKLTVTYVCECGLECGGLPAPGALLMVVADPSVLNSSDEAKRALIASWGYTVNLIDDEDNQTQFDTALAANDVVYISGSGSSAAVGTKLTAATIGVLSEDIGLVGELGIAQPAFVKRNSQGIDIIENSHYITSGFNLGSLPLYSYVPQIWTVGGTLAPGLQLLGRTDDGGSTYPTGIAVLETGAELYGGGFAAGRRVQVPWSEGGFDFSALNSDGQTIMQRAIEWAAGAEDEVVLLPIAHWELDETSGSTAVDSVGGHDGTLVNAPAWVSGQVDGGLDFDGVDDYVDLGSDAELVDVFDGGATVTGWIYPRSWGENDNGRILDKASQVSGDRDGWMIGVVGTTPALQFAQGFTGVRGYWRSDSGTLNLNTWTHFAVVYDASTVTNDAEIYLNGVLQSPLVEITPTGSIATDAGISLRMGNYAQDTTRTFDGIIDDVRIYDRTLTAAEVDEIASAGAGEGGGVAPSGVTFETYSEAGSNSDGLALNITAPAGTVSGDLLIAAVATDGLQVSQITAPAGWTLIDHGDQSAEVTLDVWWKIADGAEPSSYEFSWAAAEKSYGLVMRFTGHNATTPISISASTGGTSNTPISPAVVSTVPDSLILRIGGFDDDDINSGDPGLSGHTPITMGKSGNGNGTVSGGAGYLIQSAAGDSGTSTFWLNATEEYRTVTIAIAPE